jgi:glycosyltransferase involved in cell wall biosynthesis
MVLTIYTPTYNRESLLSRIYKSLCNQTEKSFIWLIIDDGSTDQTFSLVNDWKKNSPFEIVYKYKENGGVHTAHNFAFDIVKTELIWYVDSDDWLENDAVKIVLNTWNAKKGTYLGIFAKVKCFGKISQEKKFPNVVKASYQDLYYRYHYKGDAAIIVRTDVLKKLEKFPVYPKEKLVSESYKWIQLPDIPFLILNEYTTCKEYQKTGYTENVRYGFFKNLHGYSDLYNIHMKCAKFWHVKFEYCLKYIVSNSFLKRKNFVQMSTKPLMTIVFFPIGKVIYFILKKKWACYFSENNI